MKKYEEYQESGIEWFDQIPAHWQIWKISRAFDLISSGTTPESGADKYYLNGTTNWVNTGDLNDGVLDICAKTVTEAALRDYPTLKVYPIGTILLAMYGATIGKVSFLNIEACTNQACCALSNSNVLENKFAFYWFIANKEHIVRLGYGGGQPNISQNTIRNLKIFVPPLDEQREVINYLDHKTAQLDTLLAQKEALLRMLHQKRQALINEAVTQGLDPAAPRKPSGVAWLGDVPAHWEVKRLKQLTTKIGSGVTPLGGANVYEDHGIPLFRSQNIYPNGLRLDDVAFISEEVHQSMKNSQVETGDVLLNITGASIGRCYFYQGENKQANVNQHVCIIRPNEQIGTEYLHLALASNLGQYQIDISQNGASREGLTFTQLREFRIACPPVSEQKEIVRTVNLRLDKINEAAAAIHTQIQTLKAYRQSLISEVVTGKVDVRPAALAPLAAGTQTQLWG